MAPITTRVLDPVTGRFTKLAISRDPEEVRVLHPGEDAWTDITAECLRIASMVALGHDAIGSGPEYLGALLLRGIEAVLRRPNMPGRDHVSTAGWDGLLTRFDGNKALATVERLARVRIRHELRNKRLAS